MGGGRRCGNRAIHRVVIADDHRLFLDALEAILEPIGDIRVVGSTHEAQRVVGLLRELPPDLLVLDYAMPGVEGWSLLDRVRRTHPTIPVLILTGCDDPGLSREALYRGACGFFHKCASPDEVAPALRAAIAGETPTVDPRLTRAVAAYGLTTREGDVLAALARGLSLAEIGRELQISRPTVKSHVHNLYRKLEVNNRLEALRTIVESALFDNPYNWV